MNRNSTPISYPAISRCEKNEWTVSVSKFYEINSKFNPVIYSLASIITPNIKALP